MPSPPSTASRLADSTHRSSNPSNIINFLTRANSLLPLILHPMSVTVATPCEGLKPLKRWKSETISAVLEQYSEDLEILEMFKVPPEDRPKADSNHFDSTDIPTIDLSLLESDRGGLVRQIGEACREWGMFRIVNHEIPQHVMQVVEEHGNKFFALPEEEKLQCQSTEGNYYTGNNTEEQVHALHWAESFVMSLKEWSTLNLDVVERATMGWPPSDTFRHCMLEYIKALGQTSRKILELAAESLGLPSDFFSAPTMGPGLLFLRWNYYPACPNPADVLGAHIHTDPNLVTVLQQDHVGGLQVLKDEKWYNVRPVKGTLIMNVADYLQVWSNNHFKSVLHRVLTTRETSRISIAWVLFPQRNQTLSPPAQLVDEKHPRLYRDISVDEYRQIIIETRRATDDGRRLNGQNVIETLKI